MESAFILPDDGFTLHGRIEGRAGLWPPLEFDYRLALPNRVQGYLLAQRRATLANNADEVTRLDSDLILEHVGSWDAKYRPAKEAPLQPAPLNKQFLSYMVNQLRQEIINYVCAYTQPQLESDLGN